MGKKKKVICFGEILWDSMPMGLFLGGAPLNVAFHLHQLGEKAKIISRVGKGRLGKEALRRIRYKNLSTDFIQQDSSAETGFVEVELDEEGNPAYNIVNPVAWDKIELTDKMQEEVSKSWGMVYGSLAMRNERSRNTLFSLLGKDLIKVLDINLRKPFYNKAIIHNALTSADILKLNKNELQELIGWFSLPQEEQKAVEALVSMFGYTTVVVTKGGSGALLFHEGNWENHPGYTINVKDAVGAGDAFLAALLQGLKTGKDLRETLNYANAAGAFVASNFGATPEYLPRDIETMINECDLNVAH